MKTVNNDEGSWDSRENDWVSINPKFRIGSHIGKDSKIYAVKVYVYKSKPDNKSQSSYCRVSLDEYIANKLNLKIKDKVQVSYNQKKPWLLRFQKTDSVKSYRVNKSGGYYGISFKTPFDGLDKFKKSEFVNFKIDGKILIVNLKEIME